MAIKPLVLVFQELRSPSAQIINPTLTGCVIGPHYHVKTYDEHKDEIFAGLYDVLAGNTVLAMPAAVPGMKLKSAGFALYLDKARVQLETGTAGAITKGGELTGDVGDDFSAVGTNLKPGDTVKITSTKALTGVAGVVYLTNANRINLSSLPMGFVATDEFAVGDVATVGSVTGAITVVNASYIEIDTAFTADVTAGNLSVVRTRVVRDTTTKQTYAVKALVTTGGAVNKLQLTTSFPFDATGVSYEISRKVSKALVNASYYTLDTGAGSIMVASGAKLTVDNILRDILEYDLDPLAAQDDAALMYMEYTALDVSFAHIPASISLAADIDSQLGLTDSRNPLGLGSLVFFGNSQASFKAIGLDSEDQIGWAKAIDAVNRGGFYAQALLTDDAAIIGMFKANNVANEVPEKAQYGVAIGNHQLPLTATPAASDVGAILLDPGTSTNILFEDLTADFTNGANPVLPGDKLTVGSEVKIVDVIISANRLKVVAGSPFTSLGSGLTYTITRALTKDQQAASIAATSVALKSKRVVMTWPNRCEIAGEETDGFYLNCIVGGMICGLPPQAGITNKGAAAVDKAINTNWDYFTDIQLDTIAAGGTLIFVQETPTSLPFIRHQLTTDPGLIETGELSVVKNNDYLSLFFKGIVKPFLGEWNVTDELIQALTTAVNQGIQFQKNNKVAKIGAPLIDGKLEELKQSDISPDRVEIKLSTIQPKPLNTIGLHMIL